MGVPALSHLLYNPLPQGCMCNLEQVQLPSLSLAFQLFAKGMGILLHRVPKTE